MSKKYNVLWIDDQHESLEAVHKTAIDYNIQFWPFKSMNGGCKELEVNLSKYDAVLLDAKFFENETDVPGSEDTKWVHQAKDRIRDLDRTLAYFVLTGQAKTYASEEFNNAFPNVFEKGKDEDEDKLFNMLVEACKNRELTKLKHKYSNQFEICTEAYLGKKHFDRLHHLVLDIENPNQIKIAQDSLTGIRKIIEALFRKLNEIGCIPDEIIEDKGWINGSGAFLSNRHSGYVHNQEIIHSVIAFNIYKILMVTQDGSHDNGSKLGVDSYMASVSNTFLYQSTVLLLFDVLDYFKTFIDSNLVKERNLSKWEKKQVESEVSGEWIAGKLIRVAGNNFGTFRSSDGVIELTILPKIMDEFSFREGDNIEVTTKPSPCGTKTFIDLIKRAN
ncbi:hypothetical protein [Mangrovimonas aestuarii]|uniref:hypothetical protein n=1 Tax=Mangrovimonas aestuarii TaxID=3018443 RepID=UPI00237804EC|nr:hypothetical protein [Mangrovimonas aestuarii]